LESLRELRRCRGSVIQLRQAANWSWLAVARSRAEARLQARKPDPTGSEAKLSQASLNPGLCNTLQQAANRKWRKVQEAAPLRSRLCIGAPPRKSSRVAKILWSVIQRIFRAEYLESVSMRSQARVFLPSE